MRERRRRERERGTEGERDRGRKRRRESPKCLDYIGKNSRGRATEPLGWNVQGWGKGMPDRN